jgi:hypothetical protein
MNHLLTMMKMNKQEYTPSQTLSIEGIGELTFIESKMVNKDGAKLSEPTYWYKFISGRDKGKLIPLVWKQVEYYSNLKP